MKKITLTLLSILGVISLSYSQTYSTGLVQLSNTAGLEYAIQIDVNSTTTTLTMIGPENRWLGLGFGVQDMIAGEDLVIYDGTTLTDRYYGYPGQPAGDNAQGITPSEDPEGEQDWTVSSNVVNSGVRTLVATRANDTGNDYVFSPSAIAIDLVWARARFPGFDLEWHGPEHRGITMQSFTLGQDNYDIAKFQISPNPAKTNITINFPSFINDVSVEVYDILGKKILSKKINSISSNINVSKWNSGIYLIRVSTENTTSTKRFIKE